MAIKQLDEFSVILSEQNSQLKSQHQYCSIQHYVLPNVRLLF